MSHVIADASPSARQEILDSLNTTRAESTSVAEPQKIEIHTLGWREDHPIEEGEQPSVTIYTRVFIDGKEVPQVARAETRHSGADFSDVVLTLYGPVEIITHDRDSWAALGD